MARDLGRPGRSPGSTSRHPRDAVDFQAFFGPKERDILDAAGHQLDRALDFGWFWFIALPLLWGLRFLHRFIPNYGVNIILLTALVKLATAPLTTDVLQAA